MLDRATHVFVTNARLEALAILGPLPDLAVRQGLSDICHAKPAARREGSGTVLAIPLEGGRHCIWLLPDIPAMVDLAPMLTRAQAMTLGFTRLQPPAANPEPEPLRRLARRILRPTRGPAAMVQVLGESLVEQRQARALCAYAPGKRRLWMSDDSLSPQRDLIRTLMAGHQGPARMVSRLSEAAEDLEARLILQAIGAETLWIGSAETPGSYVTLLVDPALPLRGLALQVDAILQIAAPQVQATAPRPLLRRAAWVAAAAVAVFLLWPVPQMITVTGTAIPAKMAIAALPSDATLVAMQVRVGETVTQGQPVAQFRSTALAEQQAQEVLTISMEALNAQAAMAKNDFGGYQIATQRTEIAQARLAQIEARIAALQILAPVTGRVVQAMPQNATGAAHAAGADVVAIQEGQEFLMTLAPSRVDARRITLGMTGGVYFRGLAEAEYQIQLVTPPAPVAAPEGGSETLQAIGRISGDKSDLLMAGLAGFARLSGPSAPRIAGYGHYIIEYARVQGWKYLGLHL